jgi:hypothetical protein
MGGRTYSGKAFRDLMNSNYYPLASMKKSVAKLKASDDIDLPTLEYGQYHLILNPASNWPQGSAKYWHKEKGRARVDLSTQPNTVPLSRDEPGVIPLTRCDLLDAAGVGIQEGLGQADAAQSDDGLPAQILIAIPRPLERIMAMRTSGSHAALADQKDRSGKRPQTKMARLMRAIFSSYLPTSELGCGSGNHRPYRDGGLQYRGPPEHTPRQRRPPVT